MPHSYTFKDLNETLETNCELEILSFKMSKTVSDEAYDVVNATYWRTCSLVLAAVANSAFSKNIKAQNISILPYTPQDGSFGIMVGII